jgi:hypothetical protein
VSEACGSIVSLRDASFKGASPPSRARVEMNAFRLRLHAPLPPFTPVFVHFFLGKANMLSLF